MAEQSKTQNPANLGIVFLAAVGGWFVPGLGHLVLRRWRKALVFFVTVGALAVVGVMLRGNVFTSSGGDAFDLLGFIADFGTGMFYFLSHAINPAGADVSRAAGDYGTRMIATAGVLNMLCVLDVFHVGLGHEERRRLG